MSLFKRYQKYIYALGIISFFAIYLGYSFTSGEVLKPDNPYEDNEEVSKVSLREGLEEIKEKSDEETIENKPEVNELKDRLEPESEPAEPEIEPEEPTEPEIEPEEPTEPEIEPEEPAEPEIEPEEPAEPEIEPEEPTEPEIEPEEPAKPESEPEEPAEPESEPEEPAEPEIEPEEPAEPESEPEEPVEPESEPDEPAEPESEPEEPTEPESEPDEPAESEIEPDEPAESEIEPEEPAEPESEPEEPTEPESEPEESTESESEPEAPTEPEEPAEPESEPEEPGESEGDLDEPVDPEGENEGTEDGENSDGSEGTGNGDGSGDTGDGDGSGNPGDGDGSENPGDGDGSENPGDGDGSENPGDGDGSEDTGNNEEKDKDKPEPPVTNPDKDDYLGVVLKDKNNYQVKKSDNITFLTKNNKVSLTINDPKHDHYAYQDYLKYIEYIEDKHDLKLNDTLHVTYQASVNGKPVTVNDKNNFDAGLKVGFNRIKVELILKGNDGKTVGNDTKQFTIYNQNKSDLIIYTDIENEQLVNKDLFSFITYARLDGKLLSNDKDLTVLINNKEVSAQEENNTYHQVLKKGENTIKIIAEKDGVKKEANFTITYEQHLFDFDDKGEGISEVKLFNDSDKIEEVKIDYTGYLSNNGKLGNISSDSLIHNTGPVSEVENKDLRIEIPTFKADFANIILKNYSYARYTITVVTSSGESETRTFMASKEVEPEKTLRDSRVDILNNPTLSINKKIETKNDKLNLVVQAFDFEGTQLKPGRERVELNGKRVVIEEKNESISQYIIGKDVKFAPGENKLVFSIRDSTGHETKETYTIIYNEPEAGDEIGTASISLEAGTLGLGTLASDAEIEIIAGENGADLIDRFLKSNGIDYESTGNRQADFYLPVIHKTGISEGVKIADELKKKLEEGGLDVHSDALNPHSLGEFDYTAGSGWMYSVNGSYPDIGFSDYNFEDGDDIRIRFTLVWGADIGNVKPDSPFPDLGDW